MTLTSFAHLGRFLRSAIATVSTLLLVSGCGGSGRTSGAVCPDGGTALTYANFGQNFMNQYCVQCHGPTRAQDGYRFDSIANVQIHLGAVDSTSAAGPARTNTRMPEGMPVPTQAERQQLGEWLACGAN